MLLFRLVVGERLGKIAAHFQAAAAQTDDTHIGPIAVTGCDEISVLASSFNSSSPACIRSTGNWNSGSRSEPPCCKPRSRSENASKATCK